MMLDQIKLGMTWVIENKILIGTFASTVAGLTVFMIRLWLQVQASRAATQTLTDSIELADSSPLVTTRDADGMSLDGTVARVKDIIRPPKDERGNPLPDHLAPAVREVIESAVRASRSAVGGGK